MKTTNQPKTLFTLVAAVMTLVTLAVSPAHAALLVYEGFQYETAGADRSGSDLLHGQPDGSAGDIDAHGLGGTWQDSSAVTITSDMFVAAGSLSFGDLAAAGNHVRGDTNLNNDLFSRPITGDLSSGSELWFSVLANKLQNNFSAAEGGLVIGNQAVNNPRILLDDGTGGLQGFGVAPTTDGNNWTPYAWNGSSQSAGDAALTVPTNGSEVHLLVGQISFDTGNGGTDQYTLYDYQLNSGSVVGGTLNAIATTIEIDVDQGTLDVLSLTRQVNTAYDEIRIGASLEDVLGLEGSAVASFPLTITPAGSGYELAWESREGMLYNVRSSPDLTDEIATWTLVEGDIAATPPTNTYDVDRTEPTLFYAVEAFPAPPVTILSESFDGVTAPNLPAGWTAGADTPPDTATTQWELGTPSAVGPSAANSAPNCVGTNLGADYGTDTDIWLRTPVLDLTGSTLGTLKFRQFRDIENVPGIDLDFGSIRILAADDLADLAVMEAAVEGNDTDWQDYSKPFPSEAFAEPVVLEFRFQSDEIDNRAGWYVDNVVITVP